MKILLTGGGTAGHVSGNMALVPELKKNNYEIEYIGTEKGIEKDIVSSDQYIKYHSISAGKLRRCFSLDNVKDVFRVIKGIKEASVLIKKIKPDIVFSKGGYVTVPVVIAAHRKKIPVIIHESDITPGLANKISSKFADKICTTFPETTKMFPRDKSICTGSPIRYELFAGSAEAGKKICGFTDNKPVIIVMGGSLGATTINKLIRECVKELCIKYNVIHICGKGGTDTHYNGIQGYKQFEYVKEELCHLMATADIAVSRAGSNAIFEFLALQKPMLLIPLPKGESRGDQVLNAQSFEKSGFAITANQNELDGKKLYDLIEKLYEQKKQLNINIQKSENKNGTDNILNIIYDLSKKNKEKI